MAVQIPVVIDIEGAFDEAAKRVATASKPLQRAIEDSTANIDLKIGTKWDYESQAYVPVKKSLKEIIGLTKQVNNQTGETLYRLTASTQELATALEDAKNRYSNLSTLEQKGLSIDYKKLDAYREAITVLSSEIALRQRNVALVESATRQEIARVTAIDRGNYALIQEAKTISQINDKISSLKAKLDNLDPKSSEWTETAKEIAKATTALEKYENKYSKLTAQLTSAPGSINRLSAQMRALESEWNAMGKSAKFDKDGKLTAHAQGIVDKFKQLSAESKEVGKSLKDTAEGASIELEKTNSKLVSILKNSLRLVALHAAGRFVRNIREVTAEFELQRVALGSIIRDSERAGELFRQIKAAAIESPFEIKNLVTYTKQLSAYQIETEKLFDTTMKLADVSAGLGVDMGRLILAYGQVRAASVLRGQELRQFTEAGIPLVEKLAEKFTQLRGETVKTGEVFELISERAVPFSMIADIFDDMTSAGGMFYKMQEKQAKTLAGQWANLKDAISIMYDEIGNTRGVHNAMEKLINDARWVMKNWRAWWQIIKYVGVALGTYTALSKIAEAQTKKSAKATAEATISESVREKGIKRLITSIIGEKAAEKIATVATKLHTVATNKLAVANNVLSTSFWKLALAVANNPFGALSIVISGLITLIVSLSNRTRDFNKDIESANSSIKRLTDTRGATAQLIKDYEELSKKQKLTVEESRKLRDVTSELSRLYPRAAEGIDKNTNSLNLNISKLKEYNEEAAKAAVKGLQATIRVNKRQLKRDQKELDKLTRQQLSGWGANQFNRTARLLNFGIPLPLTNEQMSEMSVRINELREQIDAYTKSIQDMEKAISGEEDSSEKNTRQLTAWQEKIIEFNSRINESGVNVRLMLDDEIEGYSKLDDVLNNIANDYIKENETVQLLEKTIKGKTGAEEADIQKLIDRAKERRALAKEILEYYHAFYLTFTKKETYQKDAFITLMENRIKFMKDFKKGYDDLSKYLTSQGALDKQSGIMLGRGFSLEISASEQRRAAEDLSNWYQDQIDAVTAEMKRKGVKGTTITDILGQQFKGESNWAKMMRDYQQLLQSLWDAKTDFDTSQAEKNMEDALKKIEDDLKRSETARNFYNNILDLTGDEDIATNMTVSVYGGIGQDFKGRMQEQLTRALTDLQPGNIDKDLFTELMGDITLFDTDAIKEKMAGLPPEVQKVFQQVLDANEKYNAEWLIDFEKTFAKAKTYTERTEQLQKQSAQKQREAKAMGKSPEEIAAVQAYYNQKIAEVQLEALKDTYTWTKAFEDLGGVSNATLGNLINLIDEYIKKYGKDLEPQQLKELTRAKENAKAQLMSRDAYASAADSVDTLLDASARLWYYQEMGLTETEEYIKALDDQQRALLDLERAMQDIQSQTEKVISSAKKMMNVFASDEDSAYFSEQMDNISSAIFSTISAGTSLAKLLTGTGGPQDVINLVTAIADIVSSIFAADKAAKMREIEKEMKSQERLLADLEESYGRLENAIAKSFGSDYIYNYGKQLENLRAQQAAYEKQAELERQKGKKADIDKINDYERSARDVAEQIAEMQHQLSEYFTGTDLTSAAKDFANSWIEAYKQFGSTSEAMKEKFQEMVQNMVEQSLGAKIMQEILDPLFQEIDRMAETGGELSAGEIARIGSMAPEYIEKINLAMENLMSQLSAAGYNIRQAPGQFTGIARDIAGASEESINGLAAGINTQNFYMQHIDMNVAAILATLTGGSTTAGASTTGEYVDPYKDQMLLYVGSLPQMRDDMASIRTMLERVIKPNGTPATHYVSSRVS